MDPDPTSVFRHSSDRDTRAACAIVSRKLFFSQTWCTQWKPDCTLRISRARRTVQLARGVLSWRSRLAPLTQRLSSQLSLSALCPLATSRGPLHRACGEQRPRAHATVLYAPVPITPCATLDSRLVVLVVLARRAWVCEWVRRALSPLGLSCLISLTLRVSRVRAYGALLPH